MKKNEILEYLEDQNLFDFEYDMLHHIEIEHLYESNQLYEEYGPFKDCKHLVSFIMDKLIDYLRYNRSNFVFVLDDFIYKDLAYQEPLVKMFTNPIIEYKEIDTFFNKLIINVKFENEQFESSYQQNNSNNYKCEINLTLPSNEYFDIFDHRLIKTLSHELTYAYEDYNRLKGSNIEIPTFDIEIKDISYAIEKIMYLFYDQEQNTYFEEFAQDIKKNHINDIVFSRDVKSVIGEIYNIIKKSKIYRDYCFVGNIIEMLYQNKNKYNNCITTYFNQIINPKYPTKNGIKILYKKWLKIKEKFERRIPQIIYQVVKENPKNIKELKTTKFNRIIYEKL